LKPFRQLNQTLKSIGHVNFFVVEDEAIAKKFGIDTSNTGDLYLVRQSDNAYRSRSPKTSKFSLFGFPFTSEILLPAAMAKDYRKGMQAVYQLVLS